MGQNIDRCIIGSNGCISCFIVNFNNPKSIPIYNAITMVHSINTKCCYVDLTLRSGAQDLILYTVLKFIGAQHLIPLVFSTVSI